MMYNKRKNFGNVKRKIIHTFTRRGGGGLSLMTSIKWLPYKVQMVKSNFESVVTIFVLCCIPVPNFRKRGQAYDL